MAVIIIIIKVIKVIVMVITVIKAAGIITPEKGSEKNPKKTSSQN